MPLSRDEAVDLFERRRKAWLASDARAYMDLWDEDMEIEIPGWDEPVRGKQRYAELIDQSMRRMRPLAWDFHSIAVDGDRVLAEWTISGEFRGSGSTPAREVCWRGMSICTIRSGLIREWREYWDPSSIAG